MNVLLDTNILGRFVEVGHAQHLVVEEAIDALVARGDSPCLVPQTLYELWVVATRPVNMNGLGMSASEASGELAHIEALFPLLPDMPAVFVHWKQIVATQNVLGKNAHDARLVAAMAVHCVTHLLTFNVDDFSRFPSITILDPAFVAAPLAP
jgi:predicted nucleic acid-binding protein